MKHIAFVTNPFFGYIKKRREGNRKMCIEDEKKNYKIFN